MMLEGLEPGAPPALGGASSPVDGGALAAAAGPPAPGVPDVAQKVFSSLLDDEMAGVYERGIRTPQVRTGVVWLCCVFCPVALDVWGWNRDAEPMGGVRVCGVCVGCVFLSV